jgi:hypothetical protein
MHNYGDEELGRAAGRVWFEGRANPLFWQVRTTLGTSVTEDGMDATGSWRCSKMVSTAAGMTPLAGTRQQTANGSGSCARTSCGWSPDL